MMGVVRVVWMKRKGRYIHRERWERGGGDHHLDGQRDVDTRSLPSFRIPFHSHIPFLPYSSSIVYFSRDPIHLHPYLFFLFFFFSSFSQRNRESSMDELTKLT